MFPLGNVSGAGLPRHPRTRGGASGSVLSHVRCVLHRSEGKAVSAFAVTTLRLRSPVSDPGRFAPPATVRLSDWLAPRPV